MRERKKRGGTGEQTRLSGACGTWFKPRRAKRTGRRRPCEQTRRGRMGPRRLNTANYLPSAANTMRTIGQNRSVDKWKTTTDRLPPPLPGEKKQRMTKNRKRNVSRETFRRGTTLRSARCRVVASRERHRLLACRAVLNLDANGRVSRVTERTRREGAGRAHHERARRMRREGASCASELGGRARRRTGHDGADAMRDLAQRGERDAASMMSTSAADPGCFT